MLTFVFWNTYRRSLAELVASLAAEHNADLVILAESTGEPAELLAALNANVDQSSTRRGPVFGASCYPLDRT